MIGQEDEETDKQDRKWNDELLQRLGFELPSCDHFIE